jgi:tryptophan synthase beta subunit
VAAAAGVARELGTGATVLINLSGRGDKDVDVVLQRLGNDAGAAP